MEGGGFEPPKAQLTDLQSAPFGHSGIPRHLERMMRIELTRSAWKAEVLPLNYIRKIAMTNLNPDNQVIYGAGGGNRTPNLLITNQLLYR